MKFVGRVAIVSSFLLVIATQSHATFVPWGTGVWGGMQSCPYPHSSGDNASLYEDQIAEIRESISEMRRQLSAKRSEKRKLDRVDVKRSSDRIDKYFAGEYSDFMKQHIENNKQCSNYKGMTPPEQTQVGGTEGGDQIANTASEPVTGFQLAEWARACDGTKPGSVSPAVCDNPKYKSPENKRFSAADCKKALTDYRRDYAKSMKLQQEIEALEESIRAGNESIKETSAIAREELREQQREQMESGVCIGCLTQGAGYQYQKREPDWANVITNAAAGIFATTLGYQTNKMVADRNAQIGWPTQSYPAWGYGFPFLMNAMYGALGGGIGQGAFGCAGGMYGGGFGNGPMGVMGPFGMGSMYPGHNGGVFGYPGMGTPGFGGGMYPPGMGPWGGAGPWGIGGPYGGAMGFPMVGIGGGFPMGGGVAGGIGGIAGFPMGGGMMGYPMGGGVAGGIGGIAGFPMGGGMMGYPMGGGGMMGFPMGGGVAGGIGGIGGFPMGGGMMGFPMGGGVAGGIGGIGGFPMGGGMMGYPMGGGFPIGGGVAGGIGGIAGFPMGGGLMGGYPVGGGIVGGLAGGVGGAMGFPAMGGIDGGLGAIQMQQQMMEMQMRQYQMIIEQQRRAQEDAINRQRVAAGIQQEIYGLYYRLQQVQMGYGSSGYLGGSGGGVLGGSSGSGIIPGGSGVIPGGSGIIPGGTGGAATTPIGPIPGGR